MTTTKKEDEDDDFDICPICLSENNNRKENNNNNDESSTSSIDVDSSLKSLIFCRSHTCGHIFCKPCAELLYICGSDTRMGGSSVDNNNNNNNDIYYKIPTHGRCPICRTGVRLFEFIVVADDALTSTSTSTYVYPKNENVTTWPIYKSIFKGRNYLNPYDVTTPIEKPLSDDDNNNTTIQLCFRFLDRGPTIQFGKNNKEIITFNQYDQYHTSITTKKPDDDDSNDDNNNDDNDDGNDDDDGNGYSSSSSSCCYFSKKTMTFHGSIKYQIPVGPEQCIEVDCVLQFSRECEYIRDGYVRRKFVTAPPPSSSSTTPLNNDLSSDSSYHTLVDGNDEVIFVSPHRQQQQHQEYAASSVMLYQRVQLNAINQEEEEGTTVVTQPSSYKPVYNGHTLWGNTFYQSFLFGLASYHFKSSSSSNSNNDNNNNTHHYDAYISYENPNTSVWGSLDDGSPIPSKIKFHNIEWDESNRIFRGSILWFEDYGTTWKGKEKWSYEMKFDSSYMFIVSGTCKMFYKKSLLLDGEEEQEEQQEQQEVEVHQFGVDLVYINACRNGWIRGRFLVEEEHYHVHLHDLADDVISYCRSENASGIICRSVLCEIVAFASEFKFWPDAQIVEMCLLMDRMIDESSPIA